MTAQDAVWYVHLNGANLGPLGVEDLRMQYQQRGIGRDTLVWKRGTPSWVALGDSELAEGLGIPKLSDIPPPLPGEPAPLPYSIPGSQMGEPTGPFGVAT